MSNENKFRNRTIGLLLYPEDSTHVAAMDKIKTSYDYVAILHDKDVDEDGVIKKAHWHVILRFPQAKWNTAVVKELGIEVNYTQELRNFNNAMMYLIHANDPDKYQYEIGEVFGTFKERLKELLNSQDKSEGEKVRELIEFIESYYPNCGRVLTVTEFAKFCATNGYWSEFRRSGAIFCKIIEECNKKYAEDVQ